MGTPKFIGRDSETSVTGLHQGRGIDPWAVTSHCLEHVPAIYAQRGLPVWSPDTDVIAPGAGTSDKDDPALVIAPPPDSGRTSFDTHRHWTPNGGCVYSDCAHLEVCTPETLTPNDFATHTLAALVLVNSLRQSAEEDAPEGTSYRISTANVDPRNPAISWGTHTSVTVSTELWDELFLTQRRPRLLAYVASTIAAAAAFFGAGYVLPPGAVPGLDAPEATSAKGIVRPFRLSARAHHLRRLVTYATTEPYRRGLLNSRREAHASGSERLHLIALDHAPLASRLLATFLQGSLLAAEEGLVGPILEDPIQGLWDWNASIDPRTGRPVCSAELANGQRVTLPEYMRLAVAHLERLAAARVLHDGYAPGIVDNLAEIRELADALKRGDTARCARSLDWAAKLLFLKHVAYEQSLPLTHPRLRMLDHEFTSTDPDVGPFWTLWEEGLIDPGVTYGEVEAALHEGPANTRAWARGQLIQRFGSSIRGMDWGHVDLAVGEAATSPVTRITFEHPGAMPRSAVEPALRKATDVLDLQRRLSGGAEPPNPSTS